MIAIATVALLMLQDKPQDTPQDTSEHLKEVAWLVGTWEGEGKFMGGPFTSSLTFEWSMNKTFIRHNYVARMGEKVMWQDTGMTGWDRDKKRLVMFSFGMDGTIGTGDRKDGDEKNTWTWDTKLNSTDPMFREGRAIWKKVDDDTYTETAQYKKDGQWVTIIECTFKRKKDKK